MGLVNSQVRLGSAVSIHNRDSFRHFNRKGLGQVPGMDQPPSMSVSAYEAGGFAVGTGLVIGGIFVKGPGGTIMSVFGGMVAGVSLISVLLGLLTSQLSAAQKATQDAQRIQQQQSFAPPPPPAPPPRMSRSQTAAAYGAAIGPAALSILSKLI